MDQNTLFLLGFSLSLSFLLSYLYLFVAIRFGFFADVNFRSAHQTPTPTGSGIVLIVLFLIGVVSLWLLKLTSSEVLLVCLGPCLVGIVGYIDDRGMLTILVRLPVYIFAACWCIYWLDFPPINVQGVIVNLGYVGLLFGAISLLWLQNLFNFMDGIDGIAASEVVFVCFAAVLISGQSIDEWHVVSLLTGCIALGYLWMNWPRATLFMGDAGSNFFGLMLGVLALTTDFLSVWVWMILLCQFLVDTCLTIIVRLLSHRKIHEAHSQHAYQHLNRRFGTLRTLLLSIGVNVFWLLPIAVVAHQLSDFGLILLLFAAVPLIIKDWVSGAGQEVPRIEYLRTK
ncbi:MAG: glycosyl transferase [bacterium]